MKRVGANNLKVKETKQNKKSKLFSTKSAGNGRSWLKSGVHILSLKGSYREMGAQHGALLKEEIKQGALPYLGHKNSHLIERSHLFRNSPKLTHLALKGIELLQKPMLAHIPRDYIEESHAIAEATGLSQELLQKTGLQADTFVLLLRYGMGRYLMKQFNQSMGIPGCTSVVALSEHTKSGSILHARNMDYPAVGHWDLYPTVLYFDPEKGQRTISITTAGIHSVGVTAINESGLTLSTHFHCAKQVSLFGAPVHIIGSEALRKAKTLGQFIDIVEGFERAASWSMVVSSRNENRAAVIEMMHGKIYVRDADDNNGILINTNMYQSEEMHEKEILLATSAAEDFQERLNRASSLIQDILQKPKSLEAKHFAMILGDHLDHHSGKVRGIGNTISVITTVTSMISEPSMNRFWIANRHESPVSLGNYLELDPQENFINFEQKQLNELNWYDSKTCPHTVRGTNKEVALSFFRRAYMAFHNDDDIQACKAFLVQALEIDKTESSYWMALGHMEMRHHEAQKAAAAFENAIKFALSPHMSQTAKLFLGHTYDCLNMRQKALETYQTLKQEGIRSPHVRSEVNICLSKPYSWRRAEKVTFDLQFCDSMEYA